MKNSDTSVEPMSHAAHSIEQACSNARTATDWQTVLDLVFPMAVNTRLRWPSSPDEIDFVAPCIVVVDLVGSHPVLWFGDDSNNGKTWLLAGRVTLVQTHPFPRFDFVPDDQIGWNAWFWPRPVPDAQQREFLEFKRRVRETGEIVSNSWLASER